MATDERSSTETRRRALANWANFLFHMTVSLAREYVHVFVGSLSGDATGTRTPPMVAADLEDAQLAPGASLTEDEDSWIRNPDCNNIPDSLDRKMWGNAGSAWESLVMGGITTCYLSNLLLLPGQRKEESSGAPHLV